MHNLSFYTLFDGASKFVMEYNSDSKHPEFIGLMMGPARGLIDIGAQQLVVGASAALRCLFERHGLVPVDVCGGIGTAKVVHVLDFLAGIVGERSDAIPGARGAHVGFIPPLTPITIMRQLGANIRMKYGGDVY